MRLRTRAAYDGLTVLEGGERESALGKSRRRRAGSHHLAPKNRAGEGFAAHVNFDHGQLHCRGRDGAEARKSYLE